MATTRIVVVEPAIETLAAQHAADLFCAAWVCVWTIGAPRHWPDA